MLISKYGFSDVLRTGQVVLDPSRVAAQLVGDRRGRQRADWLALIVAGGFLGAARGVPGHDEQQVRQPVEVAQHPPPAGLRAAPSAATASAMSP
jgi:hypothetical protein